VARRSGRPKSSAARSESGAPGAPPTAHDGAAGATSVSDPLRVTGAATGSAVAEAMLAEEATRAHGFAGAVVPACFSVVLALPLIGGDATAKLLCAISLVLMGLASAWLFYLTRDSSDPGRYTRTIHRSYGWLMIVSIVFVEYYVGFFSPALIVLSIGVYYFGQSTHRGDSFVMPLSVIVSYALMASLTSAGVIEDRGLFAARDAAPSSRVFVIIACCGILLLALRLARVSRAALREAIERSTDALLIAQRKEAQLAEAHHQLDHALRVAVGKPGRYTGALAGDYSLDIVIGIGAIGEVYAAEHVRDGSRAAVKLLQAAALERDELVERILREGEISSQLDNPHVVRVHAAGRLRDGAPYLVMELLHGRDLAARLRQQGQFGLEDLADLAEQLAKGLDHAHAAGVVHRDLKPLNIYETHDAQERTCWKILDFGISKIASSTGTLTHEGVIGTPGYMSPEQARGTQVDLRSDIFSMAVVMYRALTGQPAFSGESTPKIMFDIVYKMPNRPSSVTRGVPSDVDLAMAIALAKDPGDRFQRATEFATALAQACRGQLSPDLRARGTELTRTYPWGQTLVVPASGVDPA